MIRKFVMAPALILTLACGAFAQLGITFCQPNANSTGQAALLSGSYLNGGFMQLHLDVEGGASGEFGYFLVGDHSHGSLNLGDGVFCLAGAGGQFYRYNLAPGTSENSVGVFDSNGVLQNISNTSTSGSGFDVPMQIPGSQPILSGQTWHFQAWYRDTPAGAGHSNFSNGLSVTFGIPQTFHGMVRIPAGAFDMGSSAPTGPPYFGSALTVPVHPVTISQGFWMGESEVTQSEYQSLVGSNPSVFVGPDLPVENVSWEAARTYCELLTAQQTALGQVSLGFEYRLPTEAEWEYACRAGTIDEFSFGPSLSCADAHMRLSNHGGIDCGANGPLDVLGFLPNAWGLYDMHGNVWEWCLDSYAPYTANSATDPFVTGGPARIIRGGAWNTESKQCRSAFRTSSDGAGPFLTAVGFRVVLARVVAP